LIGSAIIAATAACVGPFSGTGVCRIFISWQVDRSIEIEIYLES